MAIAGVVGLIAVLDADSDVAAVGVGFGVAYVIFLAGGTVACALACLARGRLEALSLGALVASGLAVDLLVLAIWLEIDSEAYAKLVGIAFVISVFGLIVLGLTPRVPAAGLARALPLPRRRGRILLAAGLATVVVLDDRRRRLRCHRRRPYPLRFGNGDLLRPLAATLRRARRALVRAPSPRAASSDGPSPDG